MLLPLTRIHQIANVLVFERPFQLAPAVKSTVGFTLAKKRCLCLVEIEESNGSEALWLNLEQVFEDESILSFEHNHSFPFSPGHLLQYLVKLVVELLSVLVGVDK